MFKFVSNESKTVLDLNSAITSSPTFKSRFSVALFVITEVKIFPLFSFISIWAFILLFVIDSTIPPIWFLALICIDNFLISFKVPVFISVFLLKFSRNFICSSFNIL